MQNNKSDSNKDEFFGSMLDGLDDSKDTNNNDTKKSVKNINTKNNKETSNQKNKKIVKNEIKKESKITSNKEVKKESVFTDILEEQKNERVYKGIYFDPDVNDVIEEFISRSEKKNIRSFVVNKMLREIFKKKGLL